MSGTNEKDRKDESEEWDGLLTVKPPCVPQEKTNSSKSKRKL